MPINGLFGHAVCVCVCVYVCVCVACPIFVKTNFWVLAFELFSSVFVVSTIKVNSWKNFSQGINPSKNIRQKNMDKDI